MTLPRLRRMCGGGWHGARWRHFRRTDTAIIHDRSGWALARGWERRETTADVVRRWARGDFRLPIIDRTLDRYDVLWGRVLCRLGHHHPVRVIDAVDWEHGFTIPGGSLYGHVTAQHRACRRPHCQVPL